MQITAAQKAAANSDAASAIDNFAAQSSQLLGQADFIKLLVTQMTTQDPMNPMDNQDMLAQMVQFSTLQGNTSLQTELANMRQSQDFAQANGLLGRQVSLMSDTGLVQGLVSGVTMDSGTPKIVVNGAAYDLSSVLAITTPTTN